jgi:lysophospholipase L1-like esterase
MRRFLTASVLSCVIASLAACSTPISPSPARPQAAPATFADYVALGDSFSAGPLVAPQAEGAPAECVRSGANYPSYLASYLKVKAFADATCSGAQTSDLYTSQSERLGLKPNVTTDAPPQLDAVTPSTDLVTLGIGGNDFTIFRDVIGQCVRQATKLPGASPCREYFSRDDVDRKMENAKAVQPRIEAAIAAIRQRAPKAKIVIVGYLRILSGEGSCEAMPLTPADADWTDSIERQINTSLSRAAAKADASFIDAYALSEGHDACAGPEAWVNGSETIFYRAAAFHPFREGMNAVAREAYRSLTDSSAPTTPNLEGLARIPRKGIPLQ